MKKFLAILLASVMTLALAVPAMAALPVVQSVELTMDEPTAGATVTDVNDSLVFAEVKDTTGEVIPQNGITGVNVTGWQVKVGGLWEDFTGATFEEDQVYIASISFSAGSTASGLTGIDDFEVTLNGVNCEIDSTSHSDYQTTVYCEFNLSSSIKVNTINATVTAEVGQSVYDTAPTFTSDPDGAVEYISELAKWYIIDEGVDPKTATEEQVQVLQSGAVFEAGRSYIGVFAFGAKSGYEFDVAITELYLNDPEAFFIPQNVNTIIGQATFTFGAADAGESTTAATTTTAAAAATTTSTATKTGDSMSPMFFIIALIAVAAAGVVTVFVARKKK